MDEGVVWVRANFPEGTSMKQTSEFANEIRKILHESPDIQFVSSRSGRADNGLDPFSAEPHRIHGGSKATRGVDAIQ